MATAQAKRFAGKWKSTTMENFDEYMKALDVNMVLRKAGKMSTTNITIGHEDDGTWTYDYTIAFKSGNLRFKLGEPFSETTADGRKVTTTVTLNDAGEFFWVQDGKPCQTTQCRTLEDDDNTMKEVCKVKDIVCTRKYVRVE